MPSPAIIRVCTAADLAVVHAMLVETWHATYDRWIGAARVQSISERWHSIEQLSAQVDRPMTLFLIAERDGRIAATAFANRIGAEGPQGAEILSSVEIGRLYVLPREQGQGLGTLLLREILTGFPRAEHFQLDVEPRNEGAIRFYRRHGFHIAAAGNDCGGQGSGLGYVRMERGGRQS